MVRGKSLLFPCLSISRYRMLPVCLQYPCRCSQELELKLESRKAGIGPGVLKGVCTILSNWLRKEGRTRGLGMATAMGLGVGPEGGIGNSHIRSIAGPSSHVRTVSIRASGTGVLVSNACLSSSSSSLTTSSTTVLTSTSLGDGEVPSVRVLGELGGSGLVGTSSS